MGDWIGLGVIVLIGFGAFLGLRSLSEPKVRTAEEFERNASENTTMMGAGMNALQELLNPAAAKAKEVQTQMKEGRSMKKNVKEKQAAKLIQSRG